MTLGEIYDRLDKMTIHEVRQMARALKVHSESSQKSGIIEVILQFAQGEIEQKHTNKGAPPKSDKHDEELANAILNYRKAVTAQDNSAQDNLLNVADSAYEARVLSEKCVYGILEETEDGCFLRTDGECAYVANSFLTIFNLRAGDEISGKIMLRAEDNVWTLVGISAVNGGENPSERKSFSSLTRIYPDKRLRLSVFNDSAACKMIDLFAPLALGQRAVICSPQKGGKTSLLKDIAGATINYIDAETVILLLNAKPEDVAEFRRVFTEFKIFSTSFDMTAAEHLRETNLAFEYAKRKTEAGKKIIILADGLISLGEEAVKKFTSCACCTQEGGSLTVIYTLPQTEKSFEITGTANAVITLSHELVRSRIYPAIDTAACFSDREERFLKKNEFSAANYIRKNFPAADAVNIFKTADYSEILEKYGNG